MTLPLHAKPGLATCSITGITCAENARPLTQVTAGAEWTILLLVMNYANVAGIQTAFDWPADWSLDDVLFTCRSGQVNAVTPTPGQPGGVHDGTVATAFNCLNGPALGAIGRLLYTTGASGCVVQVQSDFPFNNHVVDCSNQIDQIPQAARLGEVCVGTPGRHACDPLTPVEASTWGGIKASYK